MSGFLWKATVMDVNRALKEVNAFEREGDYLFSCKHRALVIKFPLAGT